MERRWRGAKLRHSEKPLPELRNTAVAQLRCTEAGAIQGSCCELKVFQERPPSSQSSLPPSLPTLPPPLLQSWRPCFLDSHVSWLCLGPATGRHWWKMVLGTKGEPGVSLILPLCLGQCPSQQKDPCFCEAHYASSFHWVTLVPSLFCVPPLPSSLLPPLPPA